MYLKLLLGAVVLATAMAAEEPQSAPQYTIRITSAGNETAIVGAVSHDGRITLIETNTPYVLDVGEANHILAMFQAVEPDSRIVGELLKDWKGKQYALSSFAGRGGQVFDGSEHSCGNIAFGF